MGEMDWDTLLGEPGHPRIIGEAPLAPLSSGGGDTTYYELSHELSAVPGCKVLGVDRRDEWKVWAKEYTDEGVGNSLDHRGVADEHGLVFNGGNRRQEDYPADMDEQDVIRRVLIEHL